MTEISKISGRSKATIENLDATEALLLKVIDKTQITAQSILDTRLGQTVNEDLLVNNGDELLKTLEEIHDRISKEIPNLVYYIPFERSSYGEKKDNDIARQKIMFANKYLSETLKLVNDTAMTDGPE
uniref:Uncharacterized protein n=1 Tax=Mucochytrium quahogii TaxID=96639 RepID=A0A7S2SKD5_9STRA|mmetsp:Transcript_17096/g.27653  ORF Transcript_17096/g.27653 Transcript_17096/m.27653 type:complete len:127 (-) Transcript_17096:107-487(-)|eukprot:CAMPEP_0203762530 /NCGR_PEP_ID=MMETSP0098-20131031/15396_1 /ASSEMBLY_ACC=CAM_ASM_000208 /TAXON_ID=96639 /ORGANISM=" , Strain NY0313808BC1" /LENGTH=126 /DNA_ID=CAMNT_0050656973 /DNA_START=226 /DNA_END=606 /DNA_ORIENTATION=+